MTDAMSDFLDFGDDHNDQFADEYANINRCEGSPSSEEAELNALDNSVSALSSNGQVEMELGMGDFTLSTSLGSSWNGVSDSFSQMRVKGDTVEKLPKSFVDDSITIPGSWPSNHAGMRSTAMKNQVPVNQNTQLLQPTSFTMSQIAPPSLPQERSNSTAASSLCSEAIKEEDVEHEMNFADADRRVPSAHESDLIEPARKRRASETVHKTSAGGSTKTAHKRSTSNASSSTRFPSPGPAQTVPVGTELDESGNPIIAKRQDRLMRNRAAALASRERKREHVMRLETSVVDLEVEKNEMKLQMLRMHEEIERLRRTLFEHGVSDDSQAVFEPPPSSADVALTTSQPPDESHSKADPITSFRARAAPTGFSPRGALKKSEIIANQIRAEEHLRNVTMRQAGIIPNGTSKTKSSPAASATTAKAAQQPDTTSIPIEKHQKKVSGGSVVFMILIFGIALFANVSPAGGLNLTGFSEDPSTSGLVLNLPQNFGEVCPETVISQLRDQGFMLSEEIQDVELRNLLKAEDRSDTQSHPALSSLGPSRYTTNWVATSASEFAYEIGNTFTITAPEPEPVTEHTDGGATVASSLLQCRKQKPKQHSADEANLRRRWRLLECEVKNIRELDDRDDDTSEMS